MSFSNVTRPNVTSGSPLSPLVTQVISALRVPLACLALGLVGLALTPAAQAQTAQGCFLTGGSPDPPSLTLPNQNNYGSLNLYSAGPPIVFDDDYWTRNDPFDLTHDYENGTSYVLVDLGSTQTVKSVQTAYNWKYANYAPYYCYVDYSTDGTTWSACSQTASSGVLTGSPVSPATSFSARYIEVAMDGYYQINSVTVNE